MNTFTDMKGKKGKRGSVVYYWLDENKNLLTVTDIYKTKRTRLIFGDSKIEYPANECVIVEIQ